jgi:hypothetical protein
MFRPWDNKSRAERVFIRRGKYGPRIITPKFADNQLETLPHLGANLRDRDEDEVAEPGFETSGSVCDTGRTR